MVKPELFLEEYRYRRQSQTINIAMFFFAASTIFILDYFYFLALAYDVCKRRILAMNGLPGLSNDASDEDRNIYFTSLVPFDNKNMVNLL